MPTVSFHPLAVADAPALSNIALRAYRDHYLDYWYDRGEWYMQHSFAPDQLALELASSNARYFRIDLNGEPVGFLKINLDKALPNSSTAPEQAVREGIELERIYLTKNATGHGVGQAAMQLVEQIARERGKKTLWLKAMDSSPAIGFYARMGFRHHATHRLSFPQMKEELRGMVVLVKTVVISD